MSVRSPAVRLLGISLAVLAVAAVGSGTAASWPDRLSAAAPPPAAAPAAPAATWGVAGPLPETTLGLPDAGVAATILELAWRDAEAAPGVWNETYFVALRAQLASLRAAGIEVVLNTGMHEPPAWALAQPGARYVDQAGRASGDQAGLNLVWNQALRPQAAGYLAKVFQELGTGFTYVRVGGGELGELTYPRTSGAADSYWAFDPAAAAADPVLGWRPGLPSPSGQAETFLTWYFSALANFQNWQIDTVRRYFAGPIAVLYPDVGVDAAEIRAAVSEGLAGSSPAEVTRRIQAGQNHDLLIGVLADPDVVAWCTWANNIDAASSVAEPARRKGIAVVGENSGDDTTLADLEALAENQRTFGLRLVIWVRYGNLVAGSPDATLADFTRISAR
jgi:hypothetical protein